MKKILAIAACLTLTSSSFADVVCRVDHRGGDSNFIQVELRRDPQDHVLQSGATRPQYFLKLTYKEGGFGGPAPSAEKIALAKELEAGVVLVNNLNCGAFSTEEPLLFHCLNKDLDQATSRKILEAGLGKKGIEEKLEFSIYSKLRARYETDFPHLFKNLKFNLKETVDLNGKPDPQGGPACQVI